MLTRPVAEIERDIAIAELATAWMPTVGDVTEESPGYGSRIERAHALRELMELRSELNRARQTASGAAP